MFLPLLTTSFWEIGEPVHPSVLFRALGGILLTTDILVVGSYGMKASGEQVLEALSLETPGDGVPYHDTFELNRSEHPRGRAWHLHPTAEVLEKLAELSLAGAEEQARNFFDHLVAYREGRPLLPLLDYHDAFGGGRLLLSGHYDETDVTAFSARMGVGFSVCGIPGPEGVESSGEEGLERGRRPVTRLRGKRITDGSGAAALGLLQSFAACGMTSFHLRARIIESARWEKRAPPSKR